MLQRVWIPSPNYSTRSSSVRLIVLHTAEGALTYQSLGSYFGSSSSGVSSHAGIDDTPGTVGEYVHRDRKAWTQGNANPYSVAAELCAFAEWDGAEWSRHPQMLANTAAWVAEEADAFGIPLVRLSADQAQDGYSSGVCQHVDLGAAGGGHWDCGPAFPIDDVIAMAQGGPAPSSEPIGDDMFIKAKDGTVYQLIYDGPSSYWRSIPAAAASLLPAGAVVADPNNNWLTLWKVGAN
jgi:hypothetical protein